MSLDTYANLKDELVSWIARSDITNASPILDTGLGLFEASAKRDLRAEEMLIEATLTAISDNNSIDLPGGFKQFSSLSLSDDPRPLAFVTREEIIRRFATAQVARPTVYASGPYNAATSRQTVQLGATPDAAYSLALLYNSSLTGLSVSNASNWLLTYAPDLYFYGTLKHILRYIGDDDTQRRADIDTGYNDAVNSIKLDQSRKRAGGDAQPRKGGMTP